MSRNHDERGTCRRRMRARHAFQLVLRVCTSEEVSTDKATRQASMATTIRIHQCRGLSLRFVHIIDHRIACFMCWLSVLYGLFHCVASRSGVPLDVCSPCGVSRHPPSAQPRVVPCGGTFVPCARSCVSCGGVLGIQPDRAARLSTVRRLASSATAVSAPYSRLLSILHQSREEPKDTKKNPRAMCHHIKATVDSQAPLCQYHGRRRGQIQVEEKMKNVARGPPRYSRQCLDSVPTAP